MKRTWDRVAITNIGLGRVESGWVRIGGVGFFVVHCQAVNIGWGWAGSGWVGIGGVRFRSALLGGVIGYETATWYQVNRKYKLVIMQVNP